METTEEVLAGSDLRGRNVVVTGASSGLGAETAGALAAVGATVILGVRDTSAGEEVAAGIRAEHPEADLRILPLDLSSLASVDAFASQVASSTDRLDVLVNNAGVMAPPLGRTTEGFELQFGINHLGHFFLTDLLFAALEKSGQARVVNVSSAGHSLSDIIWEDPNYEVRPYDKWEAYGQSKTANVLFTVGLERRLSDIGGHAYAIHPGMVATNLSRHLDKGDFRALMSRRPISEPDTEEAEAPAPGRTQLKSVAEGAATTVWAVVAPLETAGGSYLEDCRISSAKGWATDPDSAERLWSLSQDLIATRFTGQ